MNNISSQERRINTILSHLISPQINSIQTIDCSNDQDDVVLVSCVRTPIAKAKEGYYKDTPLENLVSNLIQHIITTTKIDKSLVNEVCFGKVRGISGQGARDLRIAGLLSGLPISSSVHTVNRQCGSGLQAIASSIASIKQGFFEVVIAGGMEKMSESEGTGNTKINKKALKHDKACGCYLAMGQTSEIVAKKYNISRKRQDEISLDSHKKASKATSEGKYKDEIVPIKVNIQNPNTFHVKSVVVDKDQGFRSDTTIEALSKLPPAFIKGGSTTAGNSSQVSDGAAAVLLMKRSMAKKLGLQVLGRMVSYAVVGVEPSEMGIGPAFAIPESLKKANLSINDIDLFEINEAFASQFIYCVDKLGIPWDKVNVNGGAIALGHPVGCTGARLVVSIIHELRRRKQKYGVVSMCAGSGMGCSAVFEAEY